MAPGGMNDIQVRASPLQGLEYISNLIARCTLIEHVFSNKDLLSQQEFANHLTGTPLPHSWNRRRLPCARRLCGTAGCGIVPGFWNIGREDKRMGGGNCCVPLDGWGSRRIGVLRVFVKGPKVVERLSIHLELDCISPGQPSIAVVVEKVRR